MTYKVLSLKWRPKSFNEVVGQNHITIALKNAISLERVAHAFTFSGPNASTAIHNVSAESIPPDNPMTTP